MNEANPSDQADAPPLKGRRIAILADNGVAGGELAAARKALEAAGAGTRIVAPRLGTLAPSGGGAAGGSVSAQAALGDTSPEDYDALLIVGGGSPQLLRIEAAAVHFVRAFFESEKPVAALGDGLALLIEAGVVKDRRVTGSAAAAAELRRAGAQWVDQPVVDDRGLVTGRSGADVDAFNTQMIETFATQSLPARSDGLAEG